MARGLTPKEKWCMTKQIAKAKKKCKVPDNIRFMSYDSNATLDQLISALAADYMAGRLKK